MSAQRLGGADTPTPVGAGALVRCTGRVDGDMGDATDGHGPALRRRRAVLDRPWTSLRQVHGARVVAVACPGEGAGEEADAAVSAAAGVALAVLSADCAPVALAGDGGVIGVAHAGWRGLLGGVLEATVAAMRAMGGDRIEGVLGPCIHAECYEFGARELGLVVDRYGSQVAAEDRHGRPALDLPAAVRVALADERVSLVGDLDVCTACSPGHWSWRAGRDRARQATVVWVP